MLKINSKVGITNHSTEDIYNRFSNITSIINQLPEEYRKDIIIENDTVVINNPALGNLKIKILDLKENDTIKFGTTEDSKIQFFFWLQLKPVEPYKTKFRFVLHIDIPMLFRPFVKGKLEDALNEMVDKISAI